MAATAKTDKPPAAPARSKSAPRLLEVYRRDVVPALQREFGLPNVMQVPRITKVMLNIGLGEAISSGSALQAATNDLAKVCGQKPHVRRAKKSISNFNLREGQVVGVSATLHSDKMWFFLDRLINIALTRVRDFRGIPPNSFDGQGNYTLGITEQVIFPEIDYNEIDKLRGLQVTVVTSTSSDEQALRLCELLGFPFAKRN